MSTLSSSAEALLVFPRLRIQNANAISSPLTHGFPSITHFIGLMWALERKLVAAGVPLHFHAVGVICHHYQEQITNHGRTQTFHLTRNPVDKDGSTLAIVEEGRVHLDLTLVFTVSERLEPNARSKLVQEAKELQAWGDMAYQLLSTMRVAGGSVLPQTNRGQTPKLELIPQEQDAYTDFFKCKRRQWLPGFALTENSEFLAQRHQALLESDPHATVLDAWLHASRANYVPSYQDEHAKWRWQDKWRSKGQGWVVPIPVGYGALTETQAAGSVQGARDTTTPLRFVEVLWSLGQWVSPHRLTDLEDLLWYAKHEAELGTMRCCNYCNTEPESDEDADDAYVY